MKTPSVTRAAVFHQPNQPLVWQEFQLPDPQPGEVIARIRCATICGSDLHTYTGRRASPAPGILGHEMVGEVVAIGAGGARTHNGRALRPGDRITWCMVWNCGTCFYCTHKLPSKCERLMKFGQERLAPGRELTGGFAEHCLLPERTRIFHVPAAVPDLAACPANCATATVAAVARQAGELEAQCVVVIGAGMLGLTACAMAAAHGARQVIAIEPDVERAALAERFGAGVTLRGTEPAAWLRKRVEECTEGRGAELVFEFSGSPEGAEAGWQLLRFGGQMILAGATFPARALQIPAEQIVRRMLRISGVYNYAPEDLASALEFLAASGRRFPFESLVGRVFPLSRAQQAIQYAEQARPPRVALVPDLDPAGE
jgi:alcohol dehydrogenase